MGVATYRLRMTGLDSRYQSTVKEENQVAVPNSTVRLTLSQEIQLLNHNKNWV